MGRDPFRIDHGFIGRHVEMQVRLVDAPERAQVGPERRASSFTGVAVDLASAIPIIVPGPFVGAVAHGGVGGMAAVIALPFVRIEHRAAGRDVLRHQVVASPCGRVVADPEAVLARVPRHDTDDGWAIVGIGPMPFPLIGAPTGRVGRIRMRGAFFPPRFGTARLPQKRCRSSPRSARYRADWLGCAAAG